MTVYVRNYWAWVHKGSRAIDLNSLTSRRDDLYKYRANQEGKVVRVALRVLNTVQVVRHPRDGSASR